MRLRRNRHRPRGKAVDRAAQRWKHAWHSQTRVHQADALHLLSRSSPHRTTSHAPNMATHVVGYTTWYKESVMKWVCGIRKVLRCRGGERKTWSMRASATIIQNVVSGFPKDFVAEGAKLACGRTGFFVTGGERRSCIPHRNAWLRSQCTSLLS